MQAPYWSRKADIGDSAVRRPIIEAAGFDADALEARAAQDDVAALWQSNREVAKEAGVFGLPTFRYQGELYWGQDSLPFLERHLEGARLIA